MARAFPWTVLLVGCLFLLSATSALTEEDPKQAEVLQDLRQQLQTLAQQIKDAEAGKLQAQELLDSGKAKQEAFRAEVESLKISVADKDKHGNLLQNQISLLQEEAEKLKSNEALHGELGKKFQAAGKELEATKDTLAKTLKQLADKSSLANSAHSQVAEAEKKLERAQTERDAAKKKLEEMERSAADGAKLQKHLDAEKSKSEKLKEDLSAAQEQAGQLKAALKAAEKEGAAWKTKAEAAEKVVRGAELKLEKALRDHSATQTALITAEAKAQEAAKQLEDLLTSWLPHWVADAVQPAVQQMQPALETAWRNSKQYTEKGRAKALWAIAATRTKSVAAWRSAQPTVSKAIQGSQTRLGSWTLRAKKATGPLLRKLNLLSKRGFKAAKRYAADALSHPQVLYVRRRVQQSVRQLENLLIRYMKRVPQLKPFARRPTVTYIIYAALAAPVITVLVPLLSLRGPSPKAKPAPLETRKISQRDNLPPEQLSNRKPKKARRISVGEEHVRVP